VGVTGRGQCFQRLTPPPHSSDARSSWGNQQWRGFTCNRADVPYCRFFSILLMSPVVAQATTIAVPGDYATISAAIAAASSGDTVLVSNGSYTESMKDILPGDYSEDYSGFGRAMIKMEPGVRLLSVNGAALTSIDAADSGRVIFCAEGTTGTLIKGFTIKGGNIPNTSFGYQYHGGGLCAIACTAIKVENCIFFGNNAYGHGGAKIDSENGEVVGCVFDSNHVNATSAGLGLEEYLGSTVMGTVSNCVFVDNTADVGGGGLCVYPATAPATSEAIISDCTFTRNTALYAGVGHWSGHTVVTNCTFESNSATGSGTPFPNIGGALWLGDVTETNTFSGCDFVDNSSTGAGGAIYLQKGTYEFSGCRFEDNTSSTSGGGVHVPGATNADLDAFFNACQFDGNAAGTDGGAISTGVNPADIRIHRGLFVNNTATDDGGAVYCAGAVTIALDSCTIAANDADSEGGGVFASAMTVADNPYVSKSIIAENIGGGAFQCDGPYTDPYLACCDVYGNAGDEYADCISGFATTNNNISEDPEFCDSGYTPYNVEWGSPCRDLTNCGTIGIGSPCIEDPTPKMHPVGAASEAAAFLINVPNPFNPITKIYFRLATAGEAELSIFSLDGRKVKTLVSGSLPVGSHEFTWNGLNEQGEDVSSGTYYARLETTSGVMTRTLTLLK
jgi:predicted outer membrane repeat protein